MNIPVYQNIQQIGQGGLASVYRAYHTNLGKYVVLKEIRLSPGSHADRREVDILKNLRHRYLPQVLDCFQIENNFYVVEDFIEGQDLDTYIHAQTPLPEDLILKWLRQMCEVLDYLHTRKPPIIHSDIKPSNIMIDRQGDICLIDFNISLLYGADQAILGYSSGYASPEQLLQAQDILHGLGTRRHIVDERTDLYSMAATFYSLMTGIVLDGTERRKLTEYPLPYSRQLVMLLDKAMMPNPSERYRSAKQILKAIDAMEYQTERYQRYVKRRAILSTVGAALLIGGTLCLIRGMHTQTVDAFRSDMQEIVMTYQTQGATEDLHRETLTMLSSSTYTSLWEKFPSEKAELLGIEGEYLYQQDTQSGYAAAADYYKEALELAEQADNDPNLHRYALDYAAALAMTGQNTQAEQILAGYSDRIDQEARIAVQIAEAYQAGEYENVLTLADTCKNSKNSAVCRKVFAVAASAAQRLERWQDALTWSERLAKLEQTDDAWRKTAKLCLTASETGTSFLSKALKCYERIEYPTEEDIIGTAQAEYGLGKYKKSMDKLKRIQTEDIVLQCQISYFMSLNAYGMGEMDEARQYCAKAVSACNRMTEKQKAEIDRSALERLNDQLQTGTVLRK